MAIYINGTSFNEIKEDLTNLKINKDENDKTIELTELYNHIKMLYANSLDTDFMNTFTDMDNLNKI